VTVKMSGGALVLAVQSTSNGCALYYYFATASSMPSFTKVMACEDIAPAGTDDTLFRFIFNLRPIADHLVIGQVSGNKSYSLREWSVHVSGGAPTLDTPIDYNAEVTAYLGKTATCMDAAAVELGTRTVGGVTYGADGKERVVACRVPG